MSLKSICILRFECAQAEAEAEAEAEIDQLNLTLLASPSRISLCNCRANLITIATPDTLLSYKQRSPSPRSLFPSPFLFRVATVSHALNQGPSTIFNQVLTTRHVLVGVQLLVWAFGGVPLRIVLPAAICIFSRLLR